MTDHPKPLFLPTIKGKGFTKAEIDLLREMDPDIHILPDGRYTINGETAEQIEAKYSKLTKDLAGSLKWKPELRFIPGKGSRRLK